MRGEKHPQWSGGKTLNNNGYVQKTLVLEHPLFPGRRRALEHVVVMAEHLGRPLEAGENVHHKNGNKSDNRIENLELWVSHQPPGQRTEDLLKWADEIVERYRPYNSCFVEEELLSLLP